MAVLIPPLRDEHIEAVRSTLPDCATVKADLITVFVELKEFGKIRFTFRKSRQTQNDSTEWSWEFHQALSMDALGTR